MFYIASRLLSAVSAIALLSVSASAQDGSTASDAVTQIAKDVPKSAFTGSRSKEILIAQVLVDRSRHSPGIIDGYDGGNTQRALKAFEAVNGLKVDGKIDDALMQKLSDKLGAGILKEYTITADDVAGPFEPVPSGMESMSKRDALGFASAEELLSEKFHMTPGLLKALNPDAHLSSSGSKILVIDGGDEQASGSVERIEVDKAGSELRAYDGSGNLVASYPATVGSSEFPSPSGTMTVNVIAAAPTYTFDPSDQEWGGDEPLSIAAGPNNPVGGTWIDLGKEGLRYSRHP